MSPLSLADAVARAGTWKDILNTVLKFITCHTIPSFSLTQRAFSCDPQSNKLKHLSIMRKKLIYIKSKLNPYSHAPCCISTIPRTYPTGKVLQNI